MTPDERKLLLSLARQALDLQNEVTALRLLLDRKQILTYGEYSRAVREVAALRQELRTDLEPHADADTELLNLLKAFEGPQQ